MSILKISITGPESAGKSELTNALADHYNTSYAAEYARTYLEKTDGTYDLSDLTEIAKGQLENEEKAITEARQICFFDTDMLVLKIWAEFRFALVPEVIESAFRQKRYDHYLLCKPDLDWEADPFRESPDQSERDKLFEIYKNELEKIGASYHVITGRGDLRLKSAIDFINRQIYLG